MSPLASALLLTLLGGPGIAERPAQSPATLAVVEHAQVFFLDDVDVPAEEAGRLLQLAVQPGDSVAVDQPLAQIDDRKPRLDKFAAELERQAARTRAEDDIEVRYAVASFELADAELNQDLDINRKTPGVIPISDIRRKRLARHRAELQIDRSKLDLKVAAMSAEVQSAAVQAADESILRRRIVAPFQGTVFDVYKQENEWVDMGEPVLRVVRLDRLRIDGFLDCSQVDPAEVADRPATVEVELARGRKARFPGRVVFVSPMVQAGNRCRIRAEVENRQENGHWLLRAGMSVDLVVDLQ
jgi:macrolide-specific efflux system membrane fusion protein